MCTHDFILNFQICSFIPGLDSKYCSYSTYYVTNI